MSTTKSKKGSVKEAKRGPGRPRKFDSATCAALAKLMEDHGLNPSVKILRGEGKKAREIRSQYGLSRIATANAVTLGRIASEAGLVFAKGRPALPEVEESESAAA